MLAEWLLISMLLGVTLLILKRQLRSAAAWSCVGVFLALTASGTILWKNRIQTRMQARSEFLQKLPAQGRTDGYVGSETCQACHPDQHTSWHRSFHRTMTQVATAQSVRGKFDQVKLQLSGEDFKLERRGDEFWVEMVDPDWKYVQMLEQHAYQSGRASSPPRPEPNPPRAWKRVGMLTGSHHMQAYWVPSIFGNGQFNFPFTYLFEEERWVPRNDVFLLDPGSPPKQHVWNSNCINCHSTVGQPRQNPKTQVMETRVAELGISCEACHGPAQEHVRLNSDPRHRYASHKLKKADPTIVNPSRLTSKKASDTCGQCHAIRYNNSQAQWSMDGFSYRPGGDLEKETPLARMDKHQDKAMHPALANGCFWSDGMVRVSGREFNGLVETPCYQRGELSCLSCHSMHKSDPDDQLAAGMNGNQACLQCHTAFRGKIEQHTHHRANSSGSLCYNCHMPHTTYGLLKAIRSHQITSPSVPSSVQTGRPNSCNLCHLDRSLGWTAKNLSQWYGTPEVNLSPNDDFLSAGMLWLLRGDAGQRALIAWHMGWQPAKEASGQEWFAPYLALLLEDPYSVVRYISQRSLKRLPGFEKFSYDYIGPMEDRRDARQHALEIWKRQIKSSASAKPHLLIQPNGNLQEDKVAGLLQQRNNRSLELLE